MTSISTAKQLTYTKLLSTMDNLKKNEDNIKHWQTNIKKKFILMAFVMPEKFKFTTSRHSYDRLETT